MRKWIQRHNEQQIVRWIPRWKRVRERGRSRYIWLRIVPMSILADLLLSYFGLPMIRHTRVHFDVHSLIYLPLTIGISIFVGYRYGLRLWNHLEEKYRETVGCESSLGAD
jgi:hypothetical protein